MTIASEFVQAAVVVIAIVASIVDVRTRRIPNALTLGAATAGLVVHAVTGGIDGVLAASGGWVVGLCLFLPFYLLGGMGGGDVKLLAAIGAWLGPGETVWLAIYSALAGGLLAVLVSVSRGYLTTALRNIWTMVVLWRAAGIRPLPGFTLESSTAPRLAYAIPILAGTVLTVWR
jgi:prepilin peptidase CpaA